MPHGNCFLWEPGLLWLHVISDSIIVLSYYSIPFALFYFVRKRTDFTYPGIISAFGLFILLCGTTHVMSVWTIWEPVYWISGLIKLATAIISIATAVIIWPLLPKLLALPSPSQLITSNEKLEKMFQRQKKTAQQLRKFSLAVEFSPTMVMISNNFGEIEYCNPSYSKITGFDADKIYGKKSTAFIPDEITDKYYPQMVTTLREGKEWQGEYLDQKENGDRYWRLECVAPMVDDDGSIISYVSVSHDVSERKKNEEIIKNLAFYDPLTSLPNRTLFKERIDQIKHSSDRNKTSFALMYLDLDEFKKINDSLGHPTGDALLVAAGKRITEQLRASDTVARLGGDEFAVIAPDTQSPGHAAILARKLIDTLNQKFEIENHDLFVSTSIGISIYPKDSDNIERLIKQADTALYKAKERGRNQFQFHSKEAELLSRARLDMESDLRQALNNKEFELFFQPKVKLASKQIDSVEALIRWRHPKKGLISPAEFIPIAEETGLIVPIGEWVIRAACEQLKQWHKVFAPKLQISVNLSARQFKEKNLDTRLVDILRETGIAPQYLEIEITESTIIDRPKQAITKLEKLRDLGFSIAVDDFGTGYSSLSYLKQFPIHSLKIDRSFIRELESDSKNEKIVVAIINLARSLELNIVAEGVETKGQLEFLQKHDCHEIQGFYFTKPLPEIAILRWIEQFKWHTFNGENATPPAKNRTTTQQEIVQLTNTLKPT